MDWPGARVLQSVIRRRVMARWLACFWLAGTGGACSRSTADPEEGKRLFATYCSRCHGAAGGGGPSSGGAAPAPRDFHDRAFQSTRSDAQIRDVIGGGKGGFMPPFGSTLKPAEIDLLVSVIRGFGR